MFKIRIGTIAWLSNGYGDPPRTLLEERAKVFENQLAAKKAIKKACKTHPQRKELCYNIVRVEDGQVVFSFNSKWGDSEFD